jgi:D-3-phosphoglycerate dehydrogenase
VRARPVVALLDEISPAAKDRLAALVEVVGPGADWLARAQAVITRASPVTAADLTRAPKLTVVAKHGVGLDNIDVDAARARGIVVLSTPGANATAVAEMTLALLLAAARRVPEQHGWLAGDRVAPSPQRFGVELAGKTAGVVGLGRIGSRVAKRLAGGLEMRVLYVDPNVPQDRAPAGCTRVRSLAELLPRAEALSIHCPLDESTRGMIGPAELARLPRGAILVNAARGGIVDEAALHAALTGGHLFAAASDVFAVEPPPADHPLLRLPNFVATPHVAAATFETADKVGFDIVDQVLAALAAPERAEAAETANAG